MEFNLTNTVNFNHNETRANSTAFFKRGNRVRDMPSFIPDIKPIQLMGKVAGYCSFYRFGRLANRCCFGLRK
jgi:hypothetical protein